MKKIFGVSIFIFLLFNTVVNASSKYYGRGDLQLTKGTADYFIKYIRGEKGKKPSDFYVTLDGTDAVYWYCAAASPCSGGSGQQDIESCERSTGKQCAKFAFKRSIKWKNGINPGKGKASRFNSKMSDEEMYKKLTELGFYNN